MPSGRYEVVGETLVINMTRLPTTEEHDRLIGAGFRQIEPLVYIKAFMVTTANWWPSDWPRSGPLVGDLLPTEVLRPTEPQENSMNDEEWTPETVEEDDDAVERRARSTVPRAVSNYLGDGNYNRADGRVEAVYQTSPDNDDHYVRLDIHKNGKLGIALDDIGCSGVEYDATARITPDDAEKLASALHMWSQEARKRQGVT